VDKLRWTLISCQTPHNGWMSDLGEAKRRVGCGTHEFRLDDTAQHTEALKTWQRGKAPGLATTTEREALRRGREGVGEASIKGPQQGAEKTDGLRGAESQHEQCWNGAIVRLVIWRGWQIN